MLPRVPRRRRAATLVEAAIVLNVLFLLLFAVFEYGRFVMFRQLIDNAAREGARLAVVSTNNLTTADIQAQVQTYMAGQALTSFTVSVYRIDPTTKANLGLWSDAAFGEAIAVDVTGQYAPMLPSFGILPNPVSLSARSIMRSEAN